MSFTDTLRSYTQAAHNEAAALTAEKQSAPPSSRFLPASRSTSAFQHEREIREAQSQFRHLRGRVYSATRVAVRRLAEQPWITGRLTRNPSQPLSRMIDKGYVKYDELPEAVKLFDPGDIDLLDSGHPLPRTIEQPHPLMGRRTFMDAELSALMATGQSFFVAGESARDGIPFDLLPFPPTWLHPENDDLFAETWFLKPPNSFQEPLPISREFLARTYFPDPANPFQPLSPIKMIGRAILNAEAISVAQNHSFSNQAAPSLAIIAGEEVGQLVGEEGGPVALTQEQRQELEDYVQSTIQGVLNFGKPLILDAVIKDIKQILRSPKEMSYLESSGVAAEEIFEGIGVPQVAAGKIENVTRESSATADYHLLANLIIPLSGLISETFQTRFVPLLERRGEKLIAFMKPPQVNDPQMEVERMQTANRGFGPTINDNRRFAGLPPIPGGDVHVIPQRTRVVRFTEDGVEELLAPADTPPEPVEERGLILPERNGKSRLEVEW